MGLFASKPVAPLGAFNMPVVPAYGVQQRPSNTFQTIGIVVGSAFLIYILFVLYNYLRKKNALPGVPIAQVEDITSGTIDGKITKIISAIDAPAGSGAEYGMQFWLYIKDWDYNFSKVKHILKRKASSESATESPVITLHPTDNSLQVQVAIYPNSETSGTAASPTSSSTGDSFTCTVENVPLQSWFSVSMTVFQRNLDIYINGRLVKSCILPGVPKPVEGDIIIGDGGGWSGNFCNLTTHNNMIGPEEANAFFSKGTTCDVPKMKTEDVSDSPFITLFGYTFRFSTLDKAGKELSSYTV